jgi:hypothetical protein
MDFTRQNKILWRVNSCLSRSLDQPAIHQIIGTGDSRLDLNVPCNQRLSGAGNFRKSPASSRPRSVSAPLSAGAGGGSRPLRD